MTIDAVLISALGPDRRAALLSATRLKRIAVSSPEAGRQAQDVCLGRVVHLDRRLAAAFVEIGEPRPGLLMLEDCADPRQPPATGEAVLVRVLRPAEGGKGAKLSARPPWPEALLAAARGLRPPALIEAAPDPVIAAVAATLGSTTAGSALTRIVVDDAAVVTELRQALPGAAPLLRLYTGALPLFAAEGVAEQLDAALAAAVPLPAGGALVIAETAAAVTIDIDLAGSAGGSAAARHATNRQAMAEIGHQVLLRDLAGHIVIDPLASRDRHHRAELVTELRTALAEEPGDNPPRIVRLAGFTPLGLIELTRERRRPSLGRLLGSGCPQCGEGRVRAAWVSAGDALRALIAEVRARPRSRPRLIASPAVARVLSGPMTAARAIAEARIGAPISVRIDPALPPPECRLDCEDGR